MFVDDIMGIKLHIICGEWVGKVLWNCFMCYDTLFKDWTIVYSSIGILFIQGLEYCLFIEYDTLFKDWIIYHIVYWKHQYISEYKGWNDLGRSDRMIRWTESLIHLYIINNILVKKTTHIWHHINTIFMYQYAKRLSEYIAWKRW